MTAGVLSPLSGLGDLFTPRVTVAHSTPPTSEGSSYRGMSRGASGRGEGDIAPNELERQSGDLGP